MIKRYYSANSRRVLNIIWNAAGSYDFDPPFFAFYTNGRPDLYFDTIIGLVKKWLDMDKITGFFDSFSGVRDADEYDEYLWLALENCMYEKEISERPALELLRKEHAEEFFKVQQTLSKQQMEVMSIPVYNQQQARWAFVTGRNMPLLSAKEKRLYEALLLSGELDTDAVILRLKDILTEYFKFDLHDSSKRAADRKSLFKKLWGNYKKGQLKNNDRLIVRSGTGTGDPFGSVHLNQEGGFKQNSLKTAENRAYIEGCFGKSLYPDEELLKIESLLCRDDDADCKLWFTDCSRHSSSIYATGKSQASYSPVKENSTNESPADENSVLSPKLQREITGIHGDIVKQREKNLDYYDHNALQIRESIRKLSAELEVVISSYLQHLPERSDSGKLDPSVAYRLPLFNDRDIFLRDGDEAENNLCIDILLDASQSRMNSQETIASEAYILSESLHNAGIPVQVISFRSLRGYTILERLKGFKDKDSKNIFNYYASGWNRDALAFKAAGYMIDEELRKNSSERHILLILTDASPNDSTALPPKPGETKARNYEGLAPVEDASQAVKELRASRIHTAAIFHGSSVHLENVYQMFGKEYIRVRSLAQLASGFIDLLQMVLREMDAD